MMAGLFVFGGGYKLLPVAALPNVEFPTITVTATLPGASPEAMAHGGDAARRAVRRHPGPRLR